jgi:NitT/TauT family transport system substrate-binding protein
VKEGEIRIRNGGSFYGNHGSTTTNLTLELREGTTYYQEQPAVATDGGHLSHNPMGPVEMTGASMIWAPCRSETVANREGDTAFKGGWVGAMATDLVRAERLKEQGMNLDYLTATDLNWQLLSSRSSRVKRLSQMEDKMVAMTRYSATAMLADELVDTSGVVNEHVFRIQVNSIFVRLSMLETQVMDLLLLPEPQATVARNMESPVLYDTRWNNVSMGVVVMNDTTIADATLRKSQREAFLNAYNEACDSLNELGLKRYRDIIMKRCRVTPAVVDSLPSDIQFTPAHQPFQQDVDRAVKWLNMQY